MPALTRVPPEVISICPTEIAVGRFFDEHMHCRVPYRLQGQDQECAGTGRVLSASPARRTVDCQVWAVSAVDCRCDVEPQMLVSSILQKCRSKFRYILPCRQTLNHHFSQLGAEGRGQSRRQPFLPLVAEVGGEDLDHWIPGPTAEWVCSGSTRTVSSRSLSRPTARRL